MVVRLSACRLYSPSLTDATYAAEFCAEYFSADTCGSYTGVASNWPTVAACEEELSSVAGDFTDTVAPFAFRRDHSMACRSFVAAQGKGYKGEFAKLSTYPSSIVTYNNAHGYAELVVKKGRPTAVL